jgi:hypothetical protein
MTFERAEKLIGSRASKKLENNTYLEWVGHDTLGVRLHNTVVVEIHRNGRYTLNSGGWRTVTTKDRLNKYSPASVWQTRGRWTVRVDGEDREYADGMTF